MLAKSTFHKADSRGYANHGWLRSYHSFSFANYYNPDRMHFGVIRVLNDDTVAGGKGFGEHPHDNMEIISIPLEGDLEHRDSMGNVTVIRKGDIQVMSAGTGITHSEYNKNTDSEVKFLQIWLFPNKRNVKPRYDQKALTDEAHQNSLTMILSPEPSEQSVWIHQDAWFHIGSFDISIKTDYKLKKSDNGLYAFVISGGFLINNQQLSERDGLGIEGTEIISIESLKQDSRLLLMEVPMSI